MYRHILVAIDESPTSENALDTAIGLARSLGSTLEIVHAIDRQVLHVFHEGGMQTIPASEIERALEGSGRSLLEEAGQRAQDAGIEYRARLLTGHGEHTDDLVAQAVKDSGAELLVVGSHGRRGFRRLLLGSVAENLARKVAVPLLIVRERGQPD